MCRCVVHACVCVCTCMHVHVCVKCANCVYIGAVCECRCVVHTQVKNTHVHMCAWAIMRVY